MSRKHGTWAHLQIHGLFGYALMAAGVLRVVEVCFVLNDGPSPPGFVRIFQHLPPYVRVIFEDWRSGLTHVAVDSRRYTIHVRHGRGDAPRRRVSSESLLAAVFTYVAALASTMFPTLWP